MRAAVGRDHLLQRRGYRERRPDGLSFAERANVNIFDLVRERDSIMKLPDGPAKTEAMEKWRGAPRLQFLDENGKVMQRFPNGG